MSLKQWMRAAVLLGASAPLFAVQSFARDADGNYVIEGVGQIKCEAFISYDPKTSREIGAVAAWFDGFLSAHNRLVKDTFDFTPWQTDQIAISLIRQFCTANPEANVERSAVELIGYFSKNRLRKREEIISVSNGTQAVLLYKSVRRQVIGRLEKAGHNVSKLDDGLSRAITAFQKTNDLTVSGLPDQPTLLRLFSN